MNYFQDRILRKNISLKWPKNMLTISRFVPAICAVDLGDYMGTVKTERPSRRKKIFSIVNNNA